MKMAIIIGTRPEIIKVAPVIKLLENNDTFDYFLIHTGQHYSYNLDKVFFAELNLPEPRYNLNVGSGTHSQQTGKMLIGIEKILLSERPDIVIVQGDTNTTLAGALSSVKIQIPVAHIEAGLRSYDRRMPEEINRVIVDHISDILFAPTEISKNNLLHEGLDSKKVFITGNTIVDAVYENMDLIEKKKDVLERFSISPKKYFLLTLHRQENVDNKRNLENILRGIEKVYEVFGFPIIFPIHPRTLKQIKRMGIQLNNDGIKIIDPVSYLEFLYLERNAKIVFTDSGGVQEECCILHTPCVTLRENTERPETLDVGANILVGVDPERILEGAMKMYNVKNPNWPNPFGDGTASKKILKIIESIIFDERNT